MLMDGRQLVLLIGLTLASACEFPPKPPTGDETQTPTSTLPHNGETPTTGQSPTATSLGTDAPTATPLGDATPDGSTSPVSEKADIVGGLYEANNTQCSDGLDNDRDGYTDCSDYSCRYTSSVTVCGGSDGEESNDAQCSDGLDNDANGYVDCEDFSCFWNGDVGVCDRDEDGFSPGEGDCIDDPQGIVSSSVNPSMTELCGDDFDNDCDGDYEENGCIDLDLGLRRITYIYDGDTVDIEGLGKSRLLGIDTPETNANSSEGPECYSSEATDYTTDELDGQLVNVYFDPSKANDDFVDLYGRYLVHLYTIDGTYHNGELASQGYACVFQGSTTQCMTTPDLLDLQAVAQSEGLGLWGECDNPSSVCF